MQNFKKNILYPTVVLIAFFALLVFSCNVQRLPTLQFQLDGKTIQIPELQFYKVGTRKEEVFYDWGKITVIINKDTFPTLLSVDSTTFFYVSDGKIVKSTFKRK